MKKKLLKNVVAFLAVGTLALTAFTGCGSDKEVAMGGSGVTYPNGDGTYPVSSEDTLKIWLQDFRVPGFDETPMAKAWKEQTGVNVEFIQPAGESVEAINLMIASGELPDIIYADLSTYPGGVQKYATDNVIIPLNDQIDKYMPNLKKVYEQRPEIKKLVSADDGKYFSAPFIYEDESLQSTCGPIVRKDLLDKAGLAIPETIDEWHTVLTKFKEMGMTAPLSYDFKTIEKQGGAFLGAYGTKLNFYVKDGKVRYGFLEPEMKEALKTMNTWYSEGLLDTDIVKVTDLDAKMLNGKTGGSVNWAGSGIGKYLSAKAGKDDAYNLVAAPYPVLKKGDRPQFGLKNFATNTFCNAYITTACKNVELAARFLDYGYSEKGGLLFNFGIEGESYTMVDGNPVYTDLIMKNPDSSPSDMMRKYMHNASGTFVQDKRYLTQFYQTQQQKDAVQIWKETDTLNYMLPPLSLTIEESQKIADIMGNIETNVDENAYKFIMGIKPFDEYDQVIKEIKGFKIDDALSIYQAAYDRYTKR
ncbi:MAG: extracellular solute-binding protein [Oscillospiraceae bacterium]